MKRSGSRLWAWFLGAGLPLCGSAAGFLAFVVPTMAEDIASRGDACTGPLAMVFGTLASGVCAVAACLAVLLGAALIAAGSLLLLRATRLGGS